MTIATVHARGTIMPNTGRHTLNLLAAKNEYRTFKEGVAHFFIRNGCYYVVAAAAKELPAVKKKLHEAEELHMLSARQEKNLIANEVRRMVEAGEWKCLLDNETIVARAPNGYWGDGENRICWTKMLLEQLPGHTPRQMRFDDFETNGLVGLIQRCGDSPYNAVSEAFPEENIMPWQMTEVQKGYFDDAANVRKAIKWLQAKLKEKGVVKKRKELLYEDYAKNDLLGLLEKYNDSPFAVLKKGYPKSRTTEDTMLNCPKHWLETEKNRITAIRRACERAGKNPWGMTKNLYVRYGPTGLLDYYRGSPLLAGRAGFPELNLQPEDMKYPVKKSGATFQIES
jgi:hypothetical protein